MNNKLLIRILAIIFFVILGFFCISHTDRAAQALGFIASLFFPVLIGLAVAFVINIPMSALEGLWLKIRKGAASDRERRVLRTACISLAVLLIAAVVALVILMVIPQLRESFSGLSDALSEFSQKLTEKRSAVENISPKLAYYVFDYDKSKLVYKAANWLVSGSSEAVGYAFGIIRSAAAAVYYFVIAVLVMFETLKNKESIAAQVKKLAAAYLSPAFAGRLFGELKRISDTFSSFITGQCLEACILGLMFLVGMTVLRLPYALVVSCLITVTALIPIFGAFIGLVIGAFLIVIEDPLKALWFVILFFALQQTEGNLIYPRVVGSSVGLSPLWTLLAVFIGGDLMGVMGMIFFVPLFSCCYSALSRFVNMRLSKKSEEEKKDLLDGA